MNKRFRQYIKDKEKESYTIKDMEQAFIYATNTARSCVWQSVDRIPKESDKMLAVVLKNDEGDVRITSMPSYYYKEHNVDKSALAWTSIKSLYNEKKIDND